MIFVIFQPIFQIFSQLLLLSACLFPVSLCVDVSEVCSMNVCNITYYYLVVGVFLHLFISLFHMYMP